MALSTLKTIARWALYCAKSLDLEWVDFGDQRRAAIVRFHSVCDPRGPGALYVQPSLAVTPTTFDRQMELLAQRYRCVSMDDLVEAVESRRPLPRNAVVVTFDDGYRDNYDFAYPILRRHGVPAIFYLTTSCLDGGDPFWPSEVRYLVLSATVTRLQLSLGPVQYDVATRAQKEWAIRDVKRRLAGLPRRNRTDALRELRAQSRAEPGFLRSAMLTWSQVKEMAANGMHFGAHTVTHPLLPSLPAAEAREEICESKAELEACLGRPVRHFSYPNPGGGIHCDPGVKELVRDSGYSTAVTSSSGYVGAGADLLELPRRPSAADARAFVWEIEKDALRAVLRRPAAGRAGAEDAARAAGR